MDDAAWTELLWSEPQHQDVRAAFGARDSDGNGVITVDEYVRLQLAKAAHGGAHVTREQAVAKGQALFAKVDADGDGTVSICELALAMKKQRPAATAKRGGLLDEQVAHNTTGVAAGHSSGLGGNASAGLAPPPTTFGPGEQVRTMLLLLLLPLGLLSPLPPLLLRLLVLTP